MSESCAEHTIATKKSAIMPRKKRVQDGDRPESAEPLVRALTTFRENPEVAMAICAALELLTFTSTESRALIAEKGGVDEVFTTMER